ncbi:MAG: hypothetical protein PVF96_01575 [Candidatus Bathyarchaeota archaeon]
MPENSTLLIVEDCIFPVSDARYFNVTILNPSNSVSDANITAIRLKVQGRTDDYNVTAAEPRFPFILRIGTTQTFKCKKNWSNFTGETVKVEPIAENASTTVREFQTPNVRWGVAAAFTASESVEYFTVIIRNSNESIVNLTISQIIVLDMPINANVTPALPYVIAPGETELFRCDWNWENYVTLRIDVKTEKGYEKSYTAQDLPTSVLYIDDVRFDYSNASRFDVIITSSEESTTPPMVTAINLTLDDGIIVPINVTIPPLGTPASRISSNQSQSFTCWWNWNEYRNRNVTVNAFTREGFTITRKTIDSPTEIVWNLTETNFDLDRTDHFLVKMENKPISTDDINITKIMLNGTETSFINQTLLIGEEKLYNCTLDWSGFIGTTTNITVLGKTVQTREELNYSKIVEIPPVSLKLTDFKTTEITVPQYNITRPVINITISNSNNSIQNVTIKSIILETGNKTYEIYGSLTYPDLNLTSNGYLLLIGEKLEVSWLWNWNYIGFNIKVTIHTDEGYIISETWEISPP